MRILVTRGQNINSTFCVITFIIILPLASIELVIYHAFNFHRTMVTVPTTSLTNNMPAIWSTK
jgi:hypothetical protein